MADRPPEDRGQPVRPAAAQEADVASRRRAHYARCARLAALAGPRRRPLPETASPDRGRDVVVFGATGCVGRLGAGYLAGHAPVGARIGLAGRSAERLAGLRAQLGQAASKWPLLVATSRQ